MGVAVVYRVRGTGVGSYPDMGAGEWEWRLGRQFTNFLSSYNTSLANILM
jgi:hypothetical protein